jgi:lysophospholipase
MIEASGGVVHWFARGGVRLRAAHWPHGPRGTVLLLNGRAEYIEKYLEPVAELQARGFAVWTQDWRGQGLSSRLLADPILHHVDRFDDYLADLDVLLDTLVRPSLGGRKLALIAHSMGGHLGARLLARHPAHFAQAALVAPMVDFMRHRLLPRRLARTLAHMVCLQPGKARRHGPGTSPVPRLDRPFEQNRLTQCPTRYAAEMTMLRQRPELQIGGSTWGWIRAATSSIAQVNTASFPQTLTMPVLVALAGDDRVVDNNAIRRFAEALPHGTLIELPGARHDLLREHDRFRLPLWEALDRFLEPMR